MLASAQPSECCPPFSTVPCRPNSSLADDAELDANVEGNCKIAEHLWASCYHERVPDKNERLALQQPQLASERPLDTAVKKSLVFFGEN